jgi:Protein of unknown function (DUF2589)
MAIDTAPSRVATGALQAIPFQSLIGGPLDACIKAEALAAQTSWEFIKEVGLETNPQTGEKKAVSVAFQYQKGGQMVNLNVPLLTIVPIPYISIDDVTIDFKANISAGSSSINETSSSSSLDAGGSAQIGFGIGPFSLKADFHANYSSKKDSKATQESKYSVEYTMDIHVGASQASMPAGLASVLNLLQSSIDEVPAGGAFSLSPVGVTLDISSPTVSAGVEATVRNRSGLLTKDAMVAFEITDANSTGITFDTLAVKPGAGTVDGAPSATSINVKTNDKGVAGITIKLAQGQTKTGTLLLKATWQDEQGNMLKEDTALINVVQTA